MSEANDNAPVLTADGVGVRRGDSIWRVMSWGYPKEVQLNGHHLFWMRSGSAGDYFWNREAAFSVALGRAAKSLAKARVDIKRETKRIAELKRRKATP